MCKSYVIKQQSLRKLWNCTMLSWNRQKHVVSCYSSYLFSPQVWWKNTVQFGISLRYQKPWRLRFCNWSVSRGPLDDKKVGQMDPVTDMKAIIETFAAMEVDLSKTIQQHGLLSASLYCKAPGDFIRNLNKGMVAFGGRLLDYERWHFQPPRNSSINQTVYNSYVPIRARKCEVHARKNIICSKDLFTTCV